MPTSLNFTRILMPDFFLQEPTSGLDSALAFQVMSTLKSYATDQNKTVVTTIHQPSSQIFHMFENILLIADGRVNSESFKVQTFVNIHSIFFIIKFVLALKLR